MKMYCIMLLFFFCQAFCVVQDDVEMLESLKAPLIVDEPKEENFAHQQCDTLHDTSKKACKVCGLTTAGGLCGACFGGVSGGGSVAATHALGWGPAAGKTALAVGGAIGGSASVLCCLVGSALCCINGYTGYFRKKCQQR